MSTRHAGLPWWPWLLPLAVISFVRSVQAQHDWNAIATGIQWREVVTRGGQKVRAIRIEPAKLSVQVWDTYGALEKGGVSRGYATYSLAEVIQLFRPKAAINGGFSASYSAPIPAGLLVRGGRTIAPLNSKSRVQSGVLCVSKGGVKILGVQSYKDGACQYALQSGPMLIDPDGRVAVYENEQKSAAYVRSAACLDQSGRLLLFQSEAAHLYDLARLLATSEAQGGPACKVALNLSGDVESGLFADRAGSPLQAGRLDVPIASSILVISK